jgi:type IV pilus assembly protein PilV
MMSSTRIKRVAGFSLVEVMVSLVVIAAGLLGVAKMQALALASTTVASLRSLAAMEAASLASTMHENRGYWASTAPAANAGGIVITATGPTATPTITAGEATLSAAVGAAISCTSSGGPCNSAQLAAFDLAEWSTALHALMPSYTATITCTAVSPVSCTVTIDWTERAVALTKQEAAAQAAAASSSTQYLARPTYTLFVEP